VLFPHRRGHTRFSGLFLHIVQLFLTVFELFLFACDLLLELGVFFVPGPRIAQAITRVRVERGRSKAVLAVQDVQFTREQIDLPLLILDLFFQPSNVCFFRAASSSAAALSWPACV